MIAAGRGLLILLLPGATLLGGLPGLLRVGQVDPLLWAWPALLLWALAGWCAGRARWALLLWLTAGSISGVGLLCWIAAVRAPSGASMLLLMAVACAAALGGLFLRDRRWPWGIGCALLAGLALFAGRPTPVSQAETRPVLAVITALPLFWRESEHGLAARADAPVVTLLRRRFEVRPLDGATATALIEAERLLLAQPRAMRPEEWVAIDRWVRRGGHVLVLADPLLRWPSALPLGDRRRAPAVSLLGPLLEHWGVRLAPPASMGEERHFLPDGTLLTSMAASRFDAVGTNCHVEAGGLLARCRLGRGEAVLVADADMIDDRLWLADPDAPLIPSQWSADTPALVVRWLGDLLPGERRWVRSGEALVRAVRWAVVAGTIWAALGWGLFAAGKGGFARSFGREKGTERA